MTTLPSLIALGIQGCPSLSISPALILELDIGSPSHASEWSETMMCRGGSPPSPLRRLISSHSARVSSVQTMAVASGCEGAGP